MNTKVCGLCGIEKEIIKFDLSFNNQTRKHVCKTCYGKRDRAKLKLDMLKAFNFKCSCCGEDHPDFLTLDHVKNDGAEQRALTNFNEQQIYRQARREGWPKDKYDCLCIKCNFAKGYFGICPHKSGVTPQQALERLGLQAKGTGRSLVNHNGDGLSLGPQAAGESHHRRAVIKGAKEFGFTEEQLKQFGLIK